MDTNYEDFYSEFIDIHKLATDAVTIAADKSVSASLINNVTLAKETITDAKLNQSEDEAANSFDSALDVHLQLLDKINEFSESYKDVEATYVELNEELDTLKNADANLTSLINSKPSSHDYPIAGTDPVEYDSTAYNRALSFWRNKVKALKQDCQSLNKNVKDYLQYLRDINEVNPEDGTIVVESVRPTKIGDTPLYNAELALETEALNETQPDGETSGLRELTGAERDEFISKHEIDAVDAWGNTDPNFNLDNITIMEGTVFLVDGIPATVYYVFDSYYDSTISRDCVFSYADAMCESYKNMNPDVINAVINNGTDFVIYQNESYAWPGYGAFYWAGDNAITFQTKTFVNSVGVQNDHDTQLALYCKDDYSINVPVHELGHAYEVAIGGSSYASDRQDFRDAFFAGYSNLYPGGTFNPNGYCEYYAETIKWFYSPNKDPDDLKIEAPELYQWCVDNLPPRVGG